jgi:hypothetical protein
MPDLADHAAHRRRILKHTAAVHLVQAEADQSRALILAASDRTAHLRHLDRAGALFSHHSTPCH